jgi:hypothetical protein
MPECGRRNSTFNKRFYKSVILTLLYLPFQIYRYLALVWNVAGIISITSTHISLYLKQSALTFHSIWPSQGLQKGGRSEVLAHNITVFSTFPISSSGSMGARTRFYLFLCLFLPLASSKERSTQQAVTGNDFSTLRLKRFGLGPTQPGLKTQLCHYRTLRYWFTVNLQCPICKTGAVIVLSSEGSEEDQKR